MVAQAYSGSDTHAMIVPNYVPDPLEVTGNVRLERYALRIGFIRRVVALFFGSALVVGLVAFFAPARQNLPFLVICWIANVLVTDFFRISTRGTPKEAVLSSLGLPTLLILEGFILAELRRKGLPIEYLVFGTISVAIYTLLAGRDFSFSGCWFLTVFGSSLLIVGSALASGHSIASLGNIMLANFVLLTYLIYDLSQLLYRRRLRESVGAVTDLHRDMFNFLGYFPRVIDHWNRHHIWDDFPLELQFSSQHPLKPAHELSDEPKNHVPS